MPKKTVLLSLLVLLLSVASFFVLSGRILYYTMDDSFISFRYAEHLAGGHGLVWNSGDTAPTEGFTSFLWVLVLAAVKLAGCNLEIAAKVLGCLLVLATAAVCCGAVVRLAGERYSRGQRFLAGAIAAALLLANIDLPGNAVSGMETALALFLSTLFFSAVALYLLRPGRRRAAAVGILALLCGLNRPEFNLAALVALGVALALSKQRRELLLYGCSLYVVCGLGYFLWRSHYFGMLFPLPFYVKQSEALAFPGLYNVAAFIAALWPLYIPLLLFAVTLRDENRAWLPAAAGVAALLLYYLLPDHTMGFCFRFLLPLFPALAVFAGLGILFIIGSYRHPAAGACVAALLVLYGVSQGYRSREYRYLQRYGRLARQAHVALGKALARLDGTGTKSIAICDAGAVPYFSGWRTIDTYGLNDRVIAMDRLNGRFDAGHVMDPAPDVLVLISKSAEVYDAFFEYEMPLFSAAMKRQYFKAGTIEFDKGRYYLWIFTKEQGMRRALQARLSADVPAFSRGNDRSWVYRVYLNR